MNKFKIIAVGLILTKSLFATEVIQKDTLGNIALQVGIFKSSVNGTITNEDPNGHTDFEKDLGYDDSKNINTFAIDLKNDISWLPNINMSYFKLNSSSTNTLVGKKNIDGIDLTGSVSSTIEYQEINTKLYGFLYNGPFEFNFGLNIKKIDYIQNIAENTNLKRHIQIEGPSSLLAVPYGAIKVDLAFIDTVLMASTSILSFGDNEAKDYEYSINYRVMRNIYLSYGYKYNSFKTTNSNNDKEIYDVNIKGNYISCKILF
jgi:hypothetical protein